jgi:hypothetical protein
VWQGASVGVSRLRAGKLAAKGRRRDRELELLNRHAKELNAEGNDSAAYQAAWDPE